MVLKFVIPAGPPCQAILRLLKRLQFHGQAALRLLALVCGIVAPLTCGITGILAIIFGIIALIEISKSSGALKGIGMAIVGIILPGVLIPILLMMAMLMPALSKVRILAQRTVCASNMAGLYKSLLVYSQDFDGKYPTADKWCDLLIEYTDVSKQ